MERKIFILGLGAGDMNQLPLGIYKRIKNINHMYVRTIDHPVIEELIQEGLRVESFDAIYEKHTRFEEVYEEITRILLEKAKAGEVIYAVPGHPMIAEKTVQLLLEEGERSGVEIHIEGGQSFLDAMFTAIKVDPIEGFSFLDGTSLHRKDFLTSQHTIISQVYDAFVASEVKLTLMELYPDDHPICVVTGAGLKTEKVERLPLYELDRSMKQVNNLTSVYVPPMRSGEGQYKEFWKLREIIDRLRGPGGCPWDQKQTHLSLKKYLLEEAYELIEAINLEDIDGIIEELGDVLLQVMMHARIGEDEGYFSIDDVIESISQKMIRRHPHVFGDVTAETAEDVERTWQEVKKEEKGENPLSMLDEISLSIPALMQADALQKKAAKVGFDWELAEEAWEKVLEEIEEFTVEWKKEEQDSTRVREEFGDLLFALVNVARLMDIHSEEVLNQANQKFRRRFSYVEKRVSESGKAWADYTLEMLDVFWDEAKKTGL